MSLEQRASRRASRLLQRGWRAAQPIAPIRAELAGGWREAAYVLFVTEREAGPALRRAARPARGPLDRLSRRR